MWAATWPWTRALLLLLLPWPWGSRSAWGYSAVCVYTIGDIDTVFRTSKLKGYTKDMPHIRPGQCPWGRNHTPPETFKIADLHPAVEERVQPVAPRNSPLFHNKNRYQKIAVHRVQARDGHTYNVLYLVTDKGYIHKIVEMPHGVLNILEIQPFQQPAPILAMTLDHRRAKLYVSSPSEVVQLPMDMCEVYHRSCESCVMAKDPYCGWADGKCVSVKANLRKAYPDGNCLVELPLKLPTSSYNLASLGPRTAKLQQCKLEHWLAPQGAPQGTGTMLQNLTLESSPEICPHSSFKEQEVDSLESYRNVTVALFSRYFLYCPTESHAATYKWHHNGSCIQNCSTHWPCFHFIENVTHDRYGRYTCISEENGFSQTLVREWLLKQPKPSQTLRWKSQAVATSPSFWLGFLQVMALALLFQ
ncbi:Semaphorin-7A [Chelonia mydas]|uniref:Semaphorin-7A n=1 Tax=Chelonia mydas TaxID=8469 RepID=M7AXD5_CHEMY|nr:Semaphorin-7A [Chelonia mydas]